MTTSTWRALEVPLAEGRIIVDVTGSGKLTEHFVSFERQGVSREMTSLKELATALSASHADAGQLAASDPVGFAFLVCVLSGRARYIFPRESMWSELEEHFSLDRSANEPRIANGLFQFTAYSQFMPVLKVSRLTIDLSSLEVTEESLIDAPWPPVLATAIR